MAAHSDKPIVIDLIDGIKDPNKVPRPHGKMFDAPAPESCPLGGSNYPSGSDVVYGGAKFHCRDGTWVPA